MLNFFKRAQKPPLKEKITDKSWIVRGTLPSDLLDIESLWNIKPDDLGVVILGGKFITTPRFQQNYLQRYSFTGMSHEPLALPPELEPYLAFANTLPADLLGVPEVNFNQVLLNWYQNGNHYIGRHSDDERQLVTASPIFSASLGQERVFRIRNKADGGIIKDILMPHGSYLVMCGDFQKELTHEVPKVVGAKGEKLGKRVNVTCRMFDVKQ